MGLLEHGDGASSRPKPETLAERNEIFTVSHENDARAVGIDAPHLLDDAACGALMLLVRMDEQVMDVFGEFPIVERVGEVRQFLAVPHAGSGGRSRKRLCEPVAAVARLPRRPWWRSVFRSVLQQRRVRPPCRSRVIHLHLARGQPHFGKITARNNRLSRSAEASFQRPRIAHRARSLFSWVY